MFSLLHTSNKLQLEFESEHNQGSSFVEGSSAVFLSFTLLYTILRKTFVGIVLHWLTLSIEAITYLHKCNDISSHKSFRMQNLSWSRKVDTKQDSIHTRKSSSNKYYYYQ